MKKQKKRRSPSIIRALNSIASASMQNALANKRLFLTLKSLEITHKKGSPPSPTKIPFWKKWGINQILAYITIITTLAAGLMSWNKEIITTQIAEIQAQKNEKVKVQQEFNKAIFDTRILILNQNSLCKIQNRSAIELKVERRNSLKSIVTLNATVNNVFGPQASDIISKMVSNIYAITDVCSLNGDEYDQQIKILYRNINKIFYHSIKQNSEEIKSLIKKRHQFEIPIKIYK